MNSLVFAGGVQNKKLRVGHACIFATERISKDTADWKINQLASMLEDPQFFFVSEHAKNKKSGGLGLNKWNRGYPANFEFIERPLIEKIKK